MGHLGVAVRVPSLPWTFSIDFCLVAAFQGLATLRSYLVDRPALYRILWLTLLKICSMLCSLAAL